MCKKRKFKTILQLQLILSADPYQDDMTTGHHLKLNFLHHLGQHVLRFKLLGSHCRYHTRHDTIGLQLGTKLLGVGRMGVNMEEARDDIILGTEIIFSI